MNPWIAAGLAIHDIVKVHQSMRSLPFGTPRKGHERTAASRLAWCTGFRGHGAREPKLGCEHALLAARAYGPRSRWLETGVGKAIRGEVFTVGSSNVPHAPSYWAARPLGVSPRDYWIQYLGPRLHQLQPWIY